METAVRPECGIVGCEMTTSNQGSFALWHAGQLLLYGATLFTAAALLFWIQPLFTKMVLPLLGGSPSVWNTALVFFQAALLAGYGYAHCVARYLRPRTQLISHLALLAVGAFFLPVSIDQSWQLDANQSPALWLLTLLAVSLGAPFLAVAATAPLVQRWFSQTKHPHAPDPYFLYAASNAGSVAVLLAFPLLIEPFVDTVTQSRAWTAGYVLLALFIAACGASLRPRSIGPVERPGPPEIRPTLRERAAWTAYSAVPSALLLGVTAHISTDIASAPLLWVAPLTVYLLSFVNAFSRRPLVRQGLAVRAMAFALVILAVTFQRQEPAIVFLPLHLLAFLFTSFACHAELARRRPPSTALTEFYLFLSLGGVLGGAFVAIVAPLLFDGVFEYPLGLVMAAALLPYSARTLSRVDLAVILIVAASTFGAVPLADWLGWSVPPAGWVVAMATVAALVLSRQFRPLAFALCIAALLTGAVRIPWAEDTIWSGRSFFGVYRVTETGEPPTRRLVHGTTNHGGQWMPEDGLPRPTAYYTPSSPAVEVIRSVQARERRQTVGIVGLGTGALAYYRRPGDEWRYYEIDPVIRWLAVDSGLFEMMSRHDPDAAVVLGDARLTLAREPDGRFDLLIMDVFSSDAIPTHLLTREAVATYMRKLADGGVLLLHISNRFLDLEPVVAGVVANLGHAALVGSRKPDDAEPVSAGSSWVAIASHRAALESLGPGGIWRPLDVSGSRLWRDDFSSVVGIVRWRGKDSNSEAPP